MSVPFSNTKLRVPKGFHSLLEGFCIEVLRTQPENIHAFGALYFADLLDKREESGVDPTRKSIDFDDVTRAKSKQQPNHHHGNKTNTNYHDNHDGNEKKMAATKIQAGVRGYLCRRDKKVPNAKKAETKQREHRTNYTDNDKTAAATKIQAGVRGMHTRKQFKQPETDLTERKSRDAKPKSGLKTKNSKNSINDDDDDDDDHVSYKVKYDLNNNYDGEDDDDDDVKNLKNQAATHIQAGVRGMMTRRSLKRNDGVEKSPTKASLKSSSGVSHHDNEDDDDASSDYKNLAATKIQAGVKGMQARKSLKEKNFYEKQNSSGEKVAKVNDHSDDDDRLKLLNQSATKIQAGARGLKVRNELKYRSKTVDTDSRENEAKDNRADYSKLHGGDLDLAATKIQSGIRGMKVRKEYNSKLNKNEIKKINDDDDDDDGGVTKRHHLFNDDDDDNDDDKRLKYDAAATKIQAGMRGMKVRKQVRDNKPSNLSKLNDDEDDEVSGRYTHDPVKLNDLDKAATKIQAGLRGMKVRKDFKKSKNYTLDEQPLKNDDYNDYNDLNQAATKIQAGVRGMQVRKAKTSGEKSRQAGDSDSLKMTAISATNNNKYNFDPDLAATKIQAGLRGMKTRKEFKNKLKSRSVDEQSESFGRRLDYDRELAATKIQAGLRGMKVRRDVKMKKRVEEDGE